MATMAVLAAVAVGACGDDTPTNVCDPGPLAVLADQTFAAALNVNPDSLTERNGVYHQDRVVGAGPLAEAGDQLEVTYTGWLTDGTQFDAGSFRVILGLSSVIIGWQVGLEGTQEGGTSLLVIPPASGYGLCPNGPIPGNSFLVFEITVDQLTQQ